MSQTVAIIGYGAAAVNALIALRTSGYPDKVMVFSNTDTPPYSPVMTSHYAAGTATREGMFPWSVEELSMLDAEVVCAEVTALNAAAHTLIAGGQEYAFDACLIASGASPVVDAGAFPEGATPLTLRTVADAEVLCAALTSENCDRVLVSGTSMVALKAVDACLARGKEVTLLGRSEHLMRKNAAEDTAAAFEAALVEMGVDLRLSQVIEEMELVDGQLRVTFSNGEVADYSQVLMAHGVKPNLGFVSDIELGAHDGLLVDQFMRTSAASVYAAGDVTETPNFASGKPGIAGLWKEACLQGACAGRAIAADLAGTEPQGAYAGYLPNNCVTVSNAVMLSAGTVELSTQRWSELVQRNGCLVLSVYEQDPETGAVSLVGYNVFSNNADPATSDAYDEAAMLYRRLTA